jgi:hypothetical protein
MNQEMWEILVPAHNNAGWKYPLEHHKMWDDFVKKMTGGVTIMKTTKGQWVSPVGWVYLDKMIPCRILCNKDQIDSIIDFTLEHYDQEAVMAYKISDDVILRYRNQIVPEKDKKLLEAIHKIWFMRNFK